MYSLLSGLIGTAPISNFKMSEWSIDFAKSIEDVSAGSPILLIGSAPVDIVF